MLSLRSKACPKSAALANVSLNRIIKWAHGHCHRTARPSRLAAAALAEGCLNQFHRAHAVGRAASRDGLAVRSRGANKGFAPRRRLKGKAAEDCRTPRRKRRRTRNMSPQVLECA